MRFALVCVAFAIRYRKCHALALHAMGPAHAPFLTLRSAFHVRFHGIYTPLRGRIALAASINPQAF